MNKPAEHSTAPGHFSIKAVAQATGLTVETLRAWERRYEVVQPNRDGSGRRTYTASDVARLRLLRTATELGHTISRLAALGEDELAKLVSDSGGHARISNARGQAYVDRALDATIHSDPSGVEEALTSAIALLPPNEAIHTVVVPLVREIGERWHRGEVSIAQEHMVTDIVRRLIISASRGYLRSDNAPCLVLATLSGERHEIGLLLCSWLASMRRYHTHYLGVDCPPEEIARFATEVDASAVLVSMIMPESYVPVIEQLGELSKHLRGHCDVWVGGMAARAIPADDVPSGCVVLPTTLDFEQRLDLIGVAHS
jgi:DNA-binding transcriptional MerR regulator/methylmalonyl-CoA mutase cobalamin-binding subunit